MSGDGIHVPVLFACACVILAAGLVLVSGGSLVGLVAGALCVLSAGCVVVAAVTL